jgi:glutamate/tyrosine decarboxylase-like PLP-dependent enzyme
MKVESSRIKAGETHIILDEKILTKLLEEFTSDVLNLLTTNRQRPVIPPDLLERINNLVEGPLSQNGLGLEEVTAVFKQNILPGLANTAGPRAFPWVIGGVTPASLIGALYQVLYDQINMVYGASIGPKLEEETIKLLLDLFQLSRDIFDGNFTTGATASNLCALAIARQWWGKQQEPSIDIAETGLSGLPNIEIYSSLPHVSIFKGLGILGIGRRNLINVEKITGREAMDVNSLEASLANSGAKAKIVVASAGTVNTGDFDDLVSIAAACSKYNAWLHVDAAFGLFARCSTKYQALLNGIQAADSITVDGHKWLNVPYDSGMLFIRLEHKIHQISTFSTIANYISSVIREPMNTGIENSRALRALPAWMTLKAYGCKGYEELIERNCRFAETTAGMIYSTDQYHLLAPVRLNIVLFQGNGINSPEENAKLMRAINATGKIFITSTIYANKPALRIAVCNWQTNVDQDLAAVQTALMEGMAIYKTSA